MPKESLPGGLITWLLLPADLLAFCLPIECMITRVAALAWVLDLLAVLACQKGIDKDHLRSKRVLVRK